MSMSKRITALAAVSTLVLTLTACGSTGDGSESAGAPSSTQSDSGAESTVAETVTVPDVTGMTGDVARMEIITAGLLVKFEAGDKKVANPASFTVDSTEPAAGESVDADSTVVLHVSKAD